MLTLKKRLLTCVSFGASIKVFLEKSVRVNLVLYAENVEEFLLKKYLSEGLSYLTYFKKFR